MAKPKKKVEVRDDKHPEAQALAVVPSNTQMSVVTPETLQEYQTQRLCVEAEDLNDVFYVSLKKKLSDGDAKSIALCAEILGLTKGSGLNINNTTYNQSLSINKEKNDSFASIVRKLQNGRRVEKDHGVLEAEVVE